MRNGFGGLSTIISSPSQKHLQTHKKSHAFDYENGVPVFRDRAPGIGMFLIFQDPFHFCVMKPSTVLRMLNYPNISINLI